MKCIAMAADAALFASAWRETNAIFLSFGGKVKAALGAEGAFARDEP